MDGIGATEWPHGSLNGWSVGLQLELFLGELHPQNLT